MKPVTALAVAAASALTGCYSVHVAKAPTFSHCRLAAEKAAPAELMLIQNKGWFLLNKFPIVCGNPDQDSWCPWQFFRNGTDMTHVQKPLADRAKATNERIVQLTANNGGTTMLYIPGLNVAIPYIVCHRETQVSAVLVKDGEVAE